MFSLSLSSSPPRPPLLLAEQVCSGGREGCSRGVSLSRRQWLCERQRGAPSKRRHSHPQVRGSRDLKLKFATLQPVDLLGSCLTTPMPRMTTTNASPCMLVHRFHMYGYRWIHASAPDTRCTFEIIKAGNTFGGGEPCMDKFPFLGASGGHRRTVHADL